MRAQKLTLAALALVAGLSLTACQGDEDTNGSGPAASQEAGGSGGSDAQDGSGGSGGSGGDKAGSGAEADGDNAEAPDDAPGSGGGQINTGPCKTANLQFRATHGMGEGNVLVSMKNTGDACSLKGFPGVDLKADGGPGGISAERSDLAAPSVVVKSGEETRFTLHYPPNNSGGSGVKIDRLVVTPPNETHSKTVMIGLDLPATDDSTVEGLTVDPVGTGKQ
ncbi:MULTISPECIES: DUF4232 domain-containing protein [Streptomyces]|uniref:DUF4232 domain-containing protein n=1 Tax=Streptomyces TaxID=1883 RepID=UPI0006EB9B3F|nr:MULTISPECIES: DUF4232 domain-containing protein [Streptomyces]